MPQVELQEIINRIVKDADLEESYEWLSKHYLCHLYSLMKVDPVLGRSLRLVNNIPTNDLKAMAVANGAVYPNSGNVDLTEIMEEIALAVYVVNVEKYMILYNGQLLVGDNLSKITPQDIENVHWFFIE